MHAAKPAEGGSRDPGEVVACPWHGLEFHIPTGQCLAYRNLRLRHYTVKVNGDEIKIVLSPPRHSPWLCITNTQ